MHIVFATLVDPTGRSGQNIYSREVAAALSKQESVELTLVCPEPKNLLPTRLTTKGVTTRFLPTKQTRSLRWHVLSQKPMFDALMAAHTHEEIDGIVSPLKPSLIVPPLFARQWSIPQTLLVEGLMTRNIEKIAPFKGAGTLANVIATLNATTSRCVFTAYEEASEWIESLRFVSEDCTSVFPHGINPDEMFSVPEPRAREEVGLDVSPNTLVLGFVGSFKWYHRLDLLVEAAATLRADGMPLHLLLIGEGPQLAAIKCQCSNLGIENDVTFTGFVEHERIHQYISACTALYGVVDPDHWGSPMKVYEYLACERPIIAYDSEEFAFVGERDFGQLITQMSSEEVATAVEELAGADQEELESIGKASRQYILENRTWDELADRIVACLQDD